MHHATVDWGLSDYLTFSRREKERKKEDKIKRKKEWKKRKKDKQQLF